MKTETKTPVHIFDVDLTVIRRTTAKYFLFLFIRLGYIRFSLVSCLLFDWIKYKLGFPNIDFIENAVKKMSGLKKTDIDRVSEICFEKKIKPNIFLGAEQLIREAVKREELVIFATSSFDFLIRPLERYFGIEGSLSSQMEYSDGLTTGNLVGYSLFGSKKKDAVQIWLEQNNICPQDVSFYSDSYTDIPLLEYCGNPVAVNPDRILKRKAKKYGWKILKFKDVLGSVIAT